MNYSNWDSVSSYLLENLRARISSGEFPPGSKLPSEKMLMEQYSVGRSSVREALRALQAQNLVRIEKGRGSFVLTGKMQAEELGRWVKSQSESFADLVELRNALELTAVRRATETITAEEIERLSAVNDTFSNPQNARDYVLLLRYDELFHRGIVHAARMELLEEMYDLFEKAYAEYRIKGYIFTKYIPKAGCCHKEIIEALNRRDGDRAEALLRHHINEIVADIEAVLQISDASTYH